MEGLCCRGVIYLRILYLIRFSYQMMSVSINNSKRGVACGARTANLSGAPECILGFYWCSSYSFFIFYVVFCRSFFVIFPFLFLDIVLSVLRFTTLIDYPFGIFLLFLTTKATLAYRFNRAQHGYRLNKISLPSHLYLSFKIKYQVYIHSDKS